MTRLDHFPHDVATVEEQKIGVDLVRRVAELIDFVQQLLPLTSYLSRADAVLKPGHPWVEKVREKRGELLARATTRQRRPSSSPDPLFDPAWRQAAARQLAELKAMYQEVYLDAHQNARLSPADSEKKRALAGDPRLLQLQQLSGLEGMPAQQLRDFEHRLSELQTCSHLKKNQLDADPVCPHCQFRPAWEGLEKAAEIVPRAVPS